MIFYDGIISSLQSHGGISVYFYELMKAQDSSDFLWCAEKNTFLSENHPSFVKTRARLLERYRDCNPHISDFSIFHSSYYRIPKSKSSHKIVTTVHDFTYEKYFKGPAKWIHCWQKYRAIKNSDIIICVSKNTADDLMKYCPIDKNKLRVVYNGVSDSYYPITPCLSKTKEILFVGSRVGYKNFDIAVKTLSKLPDFTLSIIGAGPLSKSEVKTLEANIPNRYQWLGRLADEELNIAYNRAYALLYPSNYEGFGIPVIEAMKAGCPVVAVNKSSIPEVAGDAALLVDEPTIDSLTSALMEVNSRRFELVNMGFEQASKFSWNKCFENTCAVYKELI